MKKTLELIGKYNILFFILIIITTVIFFNYYKYNIYSPYSDIGRELYINSQMLKGEVLYKDIYNVYAPLAYQINAFITLIFSDKLDVFRNIGLVLTLLNLFAIFLISNIYTNKYAALAITLFIIPTCAFFPSISNWITPYSYSVLYSLCSFLWSLYFLIKYIKDDNNKFLYISCLLWGFSVCSKYEFSGFILAITAAVIYKKTSKNILLKSFGCLFVFPFVSLLILLFQGCTIIDLYIAFLYMLKLSKSYFSQYFYQYNGFNISVTSLKNAILSIYYDFYYIIENLRRYNTQAPVFDIQPNALCFRSLGYVCLFMSLIFGIKLTKTKKNIEKEDILTVFLCFSAILASLKCLGSISLEIFGTYFLPILFVTIIAILYRSKILRIFNRIIIFLILTVTVFYGIDNIKTVKQFELKTISTEKGIIKVKSMFYDTTTQLITYIDNNNVNNMLILPEGALLNYIKNKDSNNKLYYLIPPNVEVLTSNAIINELNSKIPDYIIISNIMYQDFGQKSFINSWGIDIYEYIKSNMKLESTLGNDFRLFIYKK